MHTPRVGSLLHSMAEYLKELTRHNLRDKIAFAPLHFVVTRQKIRFLPAKKGLGNIGKRSPAPNEILTSEKGFRKYWKKESLPK